MVGIGGILCDLFNRGMKTQHARTGLQLEKTLYLRAQQQATAMDLSFAAYVTLLIARDLVEQPGTENIPAVRQVLMMAKGIPHLSTQRSFDHYAAHTSELVTDGGKSSGIKTHQHPDVRMHRGKIRHGLVKGMGKASAA
jgi:hypothetical protein